MHGPGAAPGFGRVPGDRTFDVFSSGPKLEGQRAAARPGGSHAEESVVSWSQIVWTDGGPRINFHIFILHSFYI